MVREGTKVAAEEEEVREEGGGDAMSAGGLDRWRARKTFGSSAQIGVGGSGCQGLSIQLREDPWRVGVAEEEVAVQEAVEGHSRTARGTNSQFLWWMIIYRLIF